jgi:DNA primase
MSSPTSKLVSTSSTFVGVYRGEKAGRYYKACCPFHHSQFMISPERGYAHCFGCQNGGDIIKLCELLEGVDFREAVRLLADKAGIKIPENFGGGAKKEKKDRLIEINEAAADWFVSELQKTPTAREYLATRGLSAETIASWRIGYAPDRRDGLAASLRSNYSSAELAEAGVAGVRELGGDEMYDRFRSRVMFPICDHAGRVVAFTGRIVGVGEPKYLNSPESPVFQKGAVLFALDRAKEAIRSSGDPGQIATVGSADPQARPDLPPAAGESAGECAGTNPATRSIQC